MIYKEIANERTKQEQQFGVQDWPMLDPVLLERDGGCSPERMAEEYEIPTEDRAKALLEFAHDSSERTFFHVLLEEVCEVAACLDDTKAMREELVQVAAVAVAMVESLDRKSQR
jgi:NTP pyrophosphatase (non-canonical NTP hydrolase)